METRVAVIAVLLKNREASTAVNAILHEYAEYIIGRFGLPYRQKGVYIISIAVDAPQNIISALSGKIGALKDVSAKTVYSDC
ncbi:MAG: iron-only hydrogenase system regulator [Alphaproteobacteria bacterium]|nr:iron-only hydrogenase system regulator [Alphaproteobacteria bacterium]